MNTQSMVVYIVSDSVGETAESVVRAAGSQFNHQYNLRYVPYISSVEQVVETVERASVERSMIVYTLVLPTLRQVMKDEARRRNVIAIDIMGPLMDAFQQMGQIPPSGEAGVRHRLDDAYFRWVEAVEFAVKYDDAKDPTGLRQADVVLIGVSRTSKTPLSMYLAHKLLKVANVPLIPETKPPKVLLSLDRNKVICMTIGSDELYSIRRARLPSLGLADSATYASRARIEEELSFARDWMIKLGCRVIDVSGRAVEETATTLLGMLRSAPFLSS